MKRSQLILAAALLASAGLAYGCAESGPNTIFPVSTASTNPTTGGDGGSGGMGGMEASADAYTLYVDTVHDGLVASCGACHSQGVVGAPIFLNDDPQAAYNLLEAEGQINHPDNSTLLLKGEHAGPAMPASMTPDVVVWLTTEAEERGLLPTTGSGDPPKPTFDDAMAEFAACMRLDVWEAMGLQLVPENQTQGEGPCKGCHNTGVGALFLDVNTELTFQQTQGNKYRLQKYVAPIFDEQGDFDKLIVSTRLWDKGNEPSLVEPPHPKYSFLYEQNVRDFVDYTLAAIEGGTCDEPYMPMQP